MKHPLGLYILALAEAGERFGFYLLFTLFVLYLQAKGYTEAQAAGTFGNYMAFAYFSPLIGGYLADRYIGHLRSVLMGAGWLACGYAVFALGGIKLMYLAFVLLVIGNGLFKPNISTMVGKLYKPGDERLDGAFIVFYMGINIGAGAAPFVAEWLKSSFGWEVALLGASGGMIMSFCALTIFGKVPGCEQHEYDEKVIDTTPADKVRSRLFALMTLCIIAGVFFFAFHQNGTTLIFWADKSTIRDMIIFGHKFTVPTTWFSAINSICIILFSMCLILFGFLFKSTISTPTKIGLGLFLTVLAYTILGVGGVAGGDHGRVSHWYLTSSIIVVSIGEIFISPLGLSMVKKMAPPKYVGLLMGFWFLCIAGGNKASGLIGHLWATWPHHAFWFLLSGIVGIAMTVVFVARPWLEESSK